MKTKFNFILLLMGMCVVGCSDDNEPDDGGSIVPQDQNITLSPLSDPSFTATELSTNQDINSFSYKFFNVISENADATFKGNAKDNVLASPVSAAICMSMLANTTDDKVKSQIISALEISDLTTLNQVCNKLLRYLPCEKNGAELAFANAVWYNKLYTINASFISTMNSWYGSPVIGVDFDAEETIKMVNDWSNQHTKGMIPQLVSEFEPQTQIFLANALYFAGAWEYPFDKSKSKSDVFYGTNGQTTVNMMHNVYSGGYAHKDGVSVFTLPFKGENYNMVFILPDESTSMESVMGLLNKKWLDETTVYSGTDITLNMPSFSLDLEADLSKVLRELGIDLNGVQIPVLNISQSGKIDMSQKTKVEFDEEGAKISAVTYTGIATAGPDTQKGEVTITINRPFYFLVKNTVTGTILMQGRINNL